MRQLYCTAPALYDEQFRDWSHLFDDPIAEYDQEHLERKLWMMLAVAELKPTSVLDVGCGVGYPALRPLYEAGLAIVGLDVSCQYLATCRGLPVVLGDAHHLPFKDSSFDLVIATEILEHVPYLDKVMAEVKRVARNGAIFSVPKELGPPDGKIHVRSFHEVGFARTLARHMRLEIVEFVPRRNRPNTGMPGWWMALCLKS